MAIEQSTDDKKEFDPIPQGKVRRPIFIKLFFAFFGISIFTAGATGAIVYYAMGDVFQMMSPENTEALKVGFQSQTIFLVLFVVIPSVFLSVLISQSIASPIRQISKSIKEIANGNMDLIADTKRKDELGNLISLFNELVMRMNQTKKRNEEISSMKSNFITVASHQLRTPASGVRWGLDVLLSEGKGTLNAEQKSIVERCISKNAETIKNLDDFLNVTQVEEGSFPYEFQEVEIAPFFEKMIQSFTLELKIKERKIIFNNKLEKDTKIIADPSRLSIVFNNVIENAIKYGTNNTAIEITLDKEDEHLIIQVSNYGMEILKEDQPKIFGQFFRAENAIKLKPDGIGLGLYLSKKIIDRHHGSITAMSENGKTTFTVFLPMREDMIAEKPRGEEFLETI